MEKTTDNSSMVCKIFMAILIGVSLFGCKKPSTNTAQNTAEVSVVTLQAIDIPIDESFIAQIRSARQVDIVARVSGFLEKIAYQEGRLVQKGQLMFTLDPKPFQAQVDSVRAEIDIRKAQVDNAQANLNRIRPLAQKNAVSKSDLDDAIGSVKTTQAALAEAQARHTKAALDLGYTRIEAPFTGLAGQSLVHEGAYIAASGSAAQLSYITSLDPIWVELSVSQNERAETRQKVQQGTLKLPKENDYRIALEISAGEPYPHKGRLTFADPSFNQQTGTFLVRAEIPNPEGLLRPGMFVKAIITGAIQPNALVVPQRAVLQSPNGQIVFVAGEQGLAEVRPVVVGRWYDQYWVIEQGLQPGDRVIVDGFMRLAPGAPVKIVQQTDQADLAQILGNKEQ